MRQDEDEYLTALYYFDKGHPSTLPDSNRYKHFVQDHRWGKHRPRVKYCPVCEREEIGTE